MKPIPSREEPEYYEKTEFIKSDFVEIVTGNLFIVEMQYPLRKMNNAEKQCFVRKEVYEHLVEAASGLPTGYKFKIWDAWRPFALQKELYTDYSVDIIKDFELERCTEEQKKKVIRKFVSDPIENVMVPPVHTTGGAVDLTIVNPNGQELDMGSEFDEFSDRTYTAFYENEKAYEIRDNRRLLFHTMTDAGFTNLPSEWWHYDYGDRFWGYYQSRPAMYMGVFVKGEINEEDK